MSENNPLSIEKIDKIQEMIYSKKWKTLGKEFKTISQFLDQGYNSRYNEKLSNVLESIINVLNSNEEILRFLFNFSQGSDVGQYGLGYFDIFFRDLKNEDFLKRVDKFVSIMVNAHYVCDVKTEHLLFEEGYFEEGDLQDCISVIIESLFKYSGFIKIFTNQFNVDYYVFYLDDFPKSNLDIFLNWANQSLFLKYFFEFQELTFTEEDNTILSAELTSRLGNFNEELLAALYEFKYKYKNNLQIISNKNKLNTLSDSEVIELTITVSKLERMDCIIKSYLSAFQKDQQILKNNEEEISELREYIEIINKNKFENNSLFKLSKLIDKNPQISDKIQIKIIDLISEYIKKSHNGYILLVRDLLQEIMSRIIIKYGDKNDDLSKIRSIDKIIRNKIKDKEKNNPLIDLCEEIISLKRKIDHSNYNIHSCIVTDVRRDSTYSLATITELFYSIFVSYLSVEKYF